MKEIVTDGTRYMAYPLDANGSPIKPGETCTDMLGSCHTVMAVGDSYWMDVDGCCHDAAHTIHGITLARTLENFAREWDVTFNEDAEKELIERYVDRIRESFGAEDR